MKLFLSALGIAAALVLCAVSGTMNVLFLSSLGKTELEASVLGAASGAADLLKCLLPFFIAWAWQGKRLVAVSSGTLVFAFLTAFSLLSALGFAADNRGTVTAERAAASDAYHRARSQLAQAARRLAAMLSHRPMTVVAAAIKGHQQSARWNSTKSCTDATLSQSRVYCAAYFALQAELETAKQAKRMQSEITELRSKVAQLERDGAAQTQDPQVSLLSRISGVAEERVRLTLIIAIALLVEAGSSLGLFLASGHAVTRLQSGKEKEVPPFATSVETRPIGCVEEFALNALQRDEAGGETLGAVRAAYISWCETRGYAPAPADAFDATFKALFKAIGLELLGERFQGVGIRKQAV